MQDHSDLGLRASFSDGSASATPLVDDPRPPVSCYIRTLNEAHRIEPVIKAALRVAREVVVVDSGSQDGTQDIAREAGARVLDNPWPGNGLQKRVGEEACRYDWLLDLDADEIVEPDLAAAISALFADGEPRSSAYDTKVLTQPPQGALWTSTMVTWRCKFYDRRKHRMPDSPIWDQLELDRQPARLPGTIVHYSFTDFKDLVAKYNRVSSARAAHMKRRSTLQLSLRVIGAYPFYFLKHYLTRSLYKQGVYGFAFAGIAAHARWLRDVKMYEARLNERTPPADISRHPVPPLDAATTDARTVHTVTDDT